MTTLCDKLFLFFISQMRKQRLREGKGLRSHSLEEAELGDPNPDHSKHSG